jgi:hypothetical protein
MVAKQSVEGNLNISISSYIAYLLLFSIPLVFPQFGTVEPPNPAHKLPQHGKYSLILFFRLYIYTT